MSSFARIILVAISFLYLAGCASAQMKQRKEQRDKVAQASKLYCDFINGDVYPDVDVAMNIEMAKRCDSSKPFSMTNYRSPSEAVGIVYCCALKEKEEAKKQEPKAVDANKSLELKPTEVKTAPNNPTDHKEEKK